MLGQDICKSLSIKEAIEVIQSCQPGTESPEDSPEIAPLDICDQREVESFFEKHQPDCLINCAAYTAVDKAETEADLAYLVNETGVKNLALSAKKTGARLVHFSTDYVFGGEGQTGAQSERHAFLESDAVSACGVYGASKLAGEVSVLDTLPDSSLIIRTSWLHGNTGPNFIDTMLRLARERDVIKVVNDQFGSPTYTRWLADTTVQLIENAANGVFHASSEGAISWFDFAKEVFSQEGIQVDLQTQSTEESGRPAPRPAWSVLSKNKLIETLGHQSCPGWKEMISMHLADRNS